LASGRVSSDLPFPDHLKRLPAVDAISRSKLVVSRRVLPPESTTQMASSGVFWSHDLVRSSSLSSRGLNCTNAAFGQLSPESGEILKILTDIDKTDIIIVETRLLNTFQ